MILKAYLKKTRTPVPAFAARIGVSRGCVYRWLDGSREPAPDQARAVVQATGGKVTLADQYGKAKAA